MSLINLNAALVRFELDAVRPPVKPALEGMSVPFAGPCDRDRAADIAAVNVEKQPCVRRARYGDADVPVLGGDFVIAQYPLERNDADVAAGISYADGRAG